MHRAPWRLHLGRVPYRVVLPGHIELLCQFSTMPLCIAALLELPLRDLFLHRLFVHSAQFGDTAPNHNPPEHHVPVFDIQGLSRTHLGADRCL